jgi:S-adenosylmethionine:tRNA ribosyltransferase-isomerase
MIAASEPVQRRADAKLLLIRSGGSIEHWPRSALVSLLDPGDLVVANDAATLPASLFGTHLPSGRSIEVRLAGRESLDPAQVNRFFAVLFGTGDFRIRTEDRPSPPPVEPGDTLQLGPLRATVEKLQDHPRLVLLRFEGSAADIWAGFAHHGKPIQYAHVSKPLALWDTWTPIAGSPVAFEPPSAGFVLSWDTLGSMTQKGIRFATLTHSAGISSTGDALLDARLPFDEPYRIPVSTAEAISRARERGARIVAVGTTVVRALEHAAVGGHVAPGLGMATQRIGPATRLRVADAVLSGTHEQGTSHYELLRAFVSTWTLARMEQQLDSHGYRTHEFGDSILVEKAAVSGMAAVSPQAGGFTAF